MKTPLEIGNPSRPPSRLYFYLSKWTDPTGLFGSLHNMAEDAGMSVDEAQAAEMVPTAGPEEIKLPEVANLSAERCWIIFKRICARNGFVSR